MSDANPPDHQAEALARFHEGNALLAQGEAAAAERAFARAIALRPDFVEARNNHANALRAQGRLMEALAGYRTARALRPNGPIINRNIAEMLALLPRPDAAGVQALRAAVSRGENVAARAGVKALLARFPEDAELLFMAGVLAMADGDYAEAMYSLRATTERAPGADEVWFERATACLLGGAAAEALGCLDRFLASNPGHRDAHINRGEALNMLGQAEAAIAAYSTALAIDPRAVLALNNRGNSLARLGALAAALADFDRAIAIDPERAASHYNRANILQNLGRDTEAVDGFDRALALDPNDALAHNNRAASLRRLNRPAQARAGYAAALALRPDLSHACANIAMMEEEDGDVIAARAHYSAALATDPDLFLARCGMVSACLPLHRDLDDDLDTSRAGYAAALNDFTAWAARTDQGVFAVGEAYPFILAYHDRENLALLRHHGDLCARLMARWAERVKLETAVPSRADQGNGGDPIRVAIVMAQFWNHSVWLAIVKGWLAHMDRERFELHLFHTGSRDDAETAWARAHAASFTMNLPGRVGDPLPWARAILAARPDVVIYPEFGMDHLGMRLASLRLAPVQAACWGHPETTGLPTMDHYISAEAFEPAEGQEYYAENLVRLPRLGCAYGRLPVVAREPDWAALGLDPDAPILICPGTPFKYQPEHDDFLVEVARAVPEGQLLLFRFPRSPGLSERLLARLSVAFRRAGLDPERQLRLLPWLARPEFYGLLGRARMMLDTVGFSGFNTVMQALECSLPVVAWEGRFLRGRLGSGILRKAGLAELVCSEREGYVALARRLAEDDAFHAAMRAGIEQRREGLFDDVGTVRALEDFLTSVTAPAPAGRN